MRTIPSFWNWHPMMNSPFDLEKPSVIRIDYGNTAFSMANEQLDMVIAMIAICKQHIFLMEDEEALRIKQYLDDPTLFARLGKQCFELIHFKMDEAWFKENFPLKNLWIGIVAYDQACVDHEVPILLQINAAKHYLRLERISTPIDLSHVQYESTYEINALTGQPDPNRFLAYPSRKLDWVTCEGGTSPLHPAIVQKLIDDCSKAEVPFWFKNWGHKWRPVMPIEDYKSNWISDDTLNLILPDGTDCGSNWKYQAFNDKKAVIMQEVKFGTVDDCLRYTYQKMLVQHQQFPDLP